MNQKLLVVHYSRVLFVLGTFAMLSGISGVFAQTPATAADKPAAKASAPMAMPPMPMDKKGSSMAGMPGMGAAGGDMRGSMMGMMKNMDAMKMTGDADRDFAMMMKMHHQGAIDMAEMELKTGKDGKMRAMAQRIIKDQQKEIKEFDQWLGKQK